MAMTAAVQLFGSSYCSAFAVMAMALAADGETDAVMAAAITAVSGLFCFFSSVVMAVVLAAAAITIAAAVVRTGTTAVDATTTVAANFFGNGPGGIFGCPSCHGSNPAMVETLKLFLPYFPLHIQNLISMYLKFLEFMHIFEMIQNMMNHMDEYQALFKMFENLGSENHSDTNSSSTPVNPLGALSPFLGSSGFSMPDLDSLQKMMEGGDLIDEFTYVEEPSGTGWYGS